MDGAERSLQELLFQWISADEQLPDRVGELLLAAWDGEPELEAELGGHLTTVGATELGVVAERQPEVYLNAIHVEGFRGVGPPVTLQLDPGPGLTLVTGRNGSGKSSFAEAGEFVLTGDNLRWGGRPAAWKEGWRNLHSGPVTRIGVDLVMSGRSGVTTVSRLWQADDSLDGGDWTVQRHGDKVQPFDADGWREPLRTYRPFLSYSELGNLIDGKPSELHDALHQLLGLGSLTAAQERLSTVRKRYAAEAKAVSDSHRQLRVDLEAVDDERAARAAALLKHATPDLAAVAEIALGTDDQASDITTLRRLTALDLPSAEAVWDAAESVRAAIDRVAECTTRESGSSRRVAELLRSALHHHELDGDGACPVCGQGTLNASWRAEAVQRAEELERVASELSQASAALDQTLGAARRLTEQQPPILDAVISGVDVEQARVAWQCWVEAGQLSEPSELARELLAAHAPLAEAIRELRQDAEAELGRRDETWQPLARRLATWHDEAAAARRNESLLDDVERAEDWLKNTAADLRDQRLAPFADASQRVWQQLRQQSNVDLGPIRLEGQGTRRRVGLDVAVDGVEATALGVMSQGELHALGLSLFLPRATVDDSPFRFVMIDDPVQAMDPAKVDGLARVFSEVGRERQVVVFTHDDRLAEALRRLRLPATVWEVQRRERSVVELRRGTDPVQRYLDDARALARSSELPDDLRGELVTSCCRSGIEAAAHTAIRARRLGAGESHSAVEDTLANATTTHQVLTLAVFDDPNRHADLLPRLRSMGSWAVAALQAARRGAHEGYSGNLDALIHDCERLAEWVAR